MNRHLKLLVISLFVLSGCASVDLKKVDTDELTIKVDLTQSISSTQLGVHLYRGWWRQAVTANDSKLTAYLTNGDAIELSPANKKGRYGIRSNESLEITDLEVESIGSVEIPFIQPLIIDGMSALMDRSFFKDDILSLSLEESFGDERYLVATGFCGGESFTSRQNLSTNAVNLDLRLREIMQRLNRAAEADLTGIIPVTLAIEEQYQTNWAPPFKAGDIRAQEETQFNIDTSGFRLKANINIEVSSGLLLGFSNQFLPTRFCF